jgi:hypothetical protein
MNERTEQQRREQALRRTLAEAVGRERLPDPVWDVLKHMGHVADSLEGKPSSEGLVHYAEMLLLYGDVLEQVESRLDTPNRKRTTEPPQLSGYEEEREKALARYLELRVASHPSVLEFRQEHLRGKLWSSETAYQRMENDNFLGSWSRGPGRERSEVTDRERLQFFARQPGVSILVPFEAGSKFEQLKTISNELMEDLFPPWNEAEAAWVVVTGRVRHIPQPLVGGVTDYTRDHLTYATINLAVEPWVATEAVVKTYQWWQARMLGRKPRALSERNLRVVQFVMRELSGLVALKQEDSPEPPRLSWRILMQRWNNANPEEAYEDERHFHRDFYRTANAVVHPYDASSSIGTPVAGLSEMPF